MMNTTTMIPCRRLSWRKLTINHILHCIAATCYNVNNCTSPINGICQRTDQCHCHDGYIGELFQAISWRCLEIWLKQDFPNAWPRTALIGSWVQVWSQVGVGKLFRTDYNIYFLSSGRDCSIIPTCSNVSDCSGRGICIDYDVCKCDKEWTGKDCAQFSCGSLDHCSGRSVPKLKPFLFC